MALRGNEKLSQVFQIPLIPNLDNASSGGHLGRGAVPGGIGPSHDWRVDDNELAADFDGSLSGLGMDLSGIPYNMSDALLALPVFNSCQIGFQYVMSAPTSPATKMNEETLTYLNQGQAYELKIKKIGSQNPQQGCKYYKSFIKVYFHERRLQFTETEQIEAWVSQRPGERILEMDSPLSYGIVDYRMDPRNLNVVEFIWDSTKECGVFLKVNCISTEFTPKKHGGEKGVPFRIQIDTYSYNDDEQPKLLNCASCQIKVFKPKGADRKQKTDRDKVEKISAVEKEKYQPSYDCTVLTEVPLENAIANKKTPPPGNQASCAQVMQNGGAGNNVVMPGSVQSVTSPHCQGPDLGNSYSDTASNRSSNSSPVSVVKQITKDTSAAEVIAWLKNGRFGNYLKFFANFTGSDLLTLTRDELIQICGLADGIRLNNALQVKSVRPRLTIYVNIQSESVFHVLYLSALTCHELIEKLANLFNASPSVIVDVHLLGVNKIHILVTDEVVQNIPDLSQYTVEVLKMPVSEENAEQYRVLLSRIDGA